MAKCIQRWSKSVTWMSSWARFWWDRVFCWQVTRWSSDDAVTSLQAPRPVRRLSSVGGDLGNGCCDHVSDVHERFRYQWPDLWLEPSVSQSTGGTRITFQIIQSIKRVVDLLDIYTHGYSSFITYWRLAQVAMFGNYVLYRNITFLYIIAFLYYIKTNVNIHIFGCTFLDKSKQ